MNPTIHRLINSLQARHSLLSKRNKQTYYLKVFYVLPYRLQLFPVCYLSNLRECSHHLALCTEQQQYQLLLLHWQNVLFESFAIFYAIFYRFSSTRSTDYFCCCFFFSFHNIAWISNRHMPIMTTV